MQPVGEGDQGGWCQNDQENVTKQEIRGPQRHFHDFHNELASWLRHCRRAKATSIPFTSPPCAIRLVVLELAGQEYGYEELLNGPLDGNDRNDSQNSMRYIPKLEEPLKETGDEKSYNV